MTRSTARTLALLTAALVPFCLATAQAPAPAQPPAPAKPAPAEPTGPRPKPTNLKVLPTTMSGDDVVKLMRQYRGDLGVECVFCHEDNPADPKKLNFASDSNPEKETARYMISMTADLNEKYLEEMPDRRYADPITCGTCHRGEKHPSIYVAPPRPQPPTPPSK